MAFDIEKLAQIAEPRSEAAKARAKARKENRAWLRMSQEIALCLHYYLRTAKMSQKEFADKMGVSPVYVGKLLKGGENLTLETICKIQAVMDEMLISIARPYVSRTVVKISVMPRFSQNAVSSEKYVGKQTAKSDYVISAGKAA